MLVTVPWEPDPSSAVTVAFPQGTHALQNELE